MANLIRVKTLAIYYIESGKTDPDNIEATYRKLNEKVDEPIRCAEFIPESDVFLDEYVDRQVGEINITPNQIVREVTGLRDFIARLFTNQRILDIGVAYEAKLTTRSSFGKP